MPFKSAELVIGRQLRCPIEDRAGLLLLAAGSVVTPRFKQLLRARGVYEIMLSPTDVDGMSSLGSRPDAAAGSRSGLRFADSPFGRDVVGILDGMIESGRLFMENNESEFKDRVIQHGCQGFNLERRELLTRKHSETCARLDGMIQNAIQGGTMNGEEIAGIVSDYLAHLVLDSDCILDLIARTKDYSGVAEHGLRMSLLGMVIAIEAGMREFDIRLIGLSGLVHDWGMARVPEHLRNAKRVLTQVEFLEIQKHPIYTLDMLRRVAAIPSQVPLICYQVHERPNGSGYPRGRRGSNIHPCARILNVADAYAALLAARPFRPALEPYAAIELLIRQAGERLVDPAAVRTLLHVVSQFPIGSTVELSDGRKARVIRRNGDKYTSPIVQVFESADGRPTNPSDESQVLDPSAQNLAIVKVLPTPGRTDIEASHDVIELKRE